MKIKKHKVVYIPTGEDYQTGKATIFIVNNSFEVDFKENVYVLTESELTRLLNKAVLFTDSTDEFIKQNIEL